jgi:hypothetical protein
MEAVNKSKSKSKSKSGSKSHSGSKSKSKSGSKTKAVRKPRVFAITEGKRLPAFPKNAFLHETENAALLETKKAVGLSKYERDEAKKKTHHSMNPIVNWPEPRSRMNAKDRNIGCLAFNLPYNVRMRLADMAAKNIGCRGITLKRTGQYTIFGDNEQNYIVGDEYAYGKKKRKGNRTKKNHTKKKK